MRKKLDYMPVDDAVMAALAAVADTDGKACMTFRTLQEQAGGISRDVLRRSIHRLEIAGRLVELPRTKAREVTTFQIKDAVYRTPYSVYRTPYSPTPSAEISTHSDSRTKKFRANTVRHTVVSSLQSRSIQETTSCIKANTLTHKICLVKQKTVLNLEKICKISKCPVKNLYPDGWTAQSHTLLTNFPEWAALLQRGLLVEDDLTWIQSCYMDLFFETGAWLEYDMYWRMLAFCLVEQEQMYLDNGFRHQKTPAFRAAFYRKRWSDVRMVCYDELAYHAYRILGLRRQLSTTAANQFAAGPYAYALYARLADEDIHVIDYLHWVADELIPNVQFDFQFRHLTTDTTWANFVGSTE